jgi:biotin carboxylase
VRAVLICHNAELAAVVLDALRANAIVPLLICGEAAAQAFKFSRLRSKVILAGKRSGEPETVCKVINSHHSQAPIGVVMAADVDGLATIDAIRERLLPPVYPMPARGVLEMLDDKWAFYQYAAGLGLNLPPTIAFSGRNSIDAVRVARDIGFPAVIKPVKGFAGRGFTLVPSASGLADAMAADDGRTGAVVVQRFIAGRDIGLAVLACGGEMKAAATFYCTPYDGAEFADMPDFAGIGRRIVSDTGYNGIANFDARLDEHGRIWLLECNPRFFMRLTASRFCGLDFLKLGLPGSVFSPPMVAVGTYYARRDMISMRGLARLFSGQLPPRLALKSLGEILADPLPLLMRRLSRASIRRALRLLAAGVPLP